MAFLRIKPVRKTCKETGKSSTYNYVYEVESYKVRGKVKQKTVRLLGKYIRLDKRRLEKFPINKAAECDSKEQLLKEIFAFNLLNYGFRKEAEKPFILKNGSIVVNLKTNRVFDSETKADVYVNINDKFFGTKTIRRALESSSSDLFDFVKSLVDAGIVGIEFSEFRKCKQKGTPSALYDMKLLQAIIDKFGHFSISQTKEMNFSDFQKEIGY